MISYHTCPLAFEEGKETGGMNIYVYEISRSLARMGYLVDVITRCQDKDNSKIVEVEKNFRVIHLKAGPHGHFPKAKLIDFIPEFIKSFKQFKEEEKINYDLIHAHYYQSGVIAIEIQKTLSKKIPLVMSFHTLALMKNLVARSASELESQQRIQIEFELTKKADAIITPSLSDKEYLKYLYGSDEEKIFEIPPGVNTRLFQPMDKVEAKQRLKIVSDEKILLFVGRIEPLKGIDLLLYSIKILMSQSPQLKIKLMIVGGDVSQHITKWSPQLIQLNKLRSLLGIEKQVEFVGQKPQHQLPYYYNASEIVVMPSHYESFGMVAAEAMACGVPVITTNVTGVSGLIDELRSTLITTVNNPLLLASQIKRLLSNQEIYQHVRKNIMENIEDLKWEEVAKKMEKVYSKL